MLIFLLSSCQKDAPVFPKGSNGLLGSGGSTGSSSANGEYQPFTKGSYWKQASSIFLVDTAVNTLTGNTATFNNILFYEVNQDFKKSGQFKGYYGYANHTYLMRAATVVNGIVVTMPYYNDNVAIGTTWTGSVTDNGLINGVPGRFIGKATEKGISRTVNGKNYTNVVHTMLDLQYDLGLGYSTVITYEFYLAKGIGVIETNSYSGGTKASSAILLEYNVK